MDVFFALLLLFVAVLAFVAWRVTSIVSGQSSTGGNGRAKPRRATGDRVYYLELVGEQHYRDATSRARVGDEVQLLTENGNPHDPEALVVCDKSGRTLGYIQRGTWLQRALIWEEKGCEAYIDALTQQRGFRNVRISVTLTKDGPVGSRQFSGAR